MNSLFSSFDAFCVEILLGKNVNTSSTSSSPSPATYSKAIKLEQEQGNSRGSSQPSDRKEKLGSSPRLAPEFDGLTCFETFVFH
ncbi:Avr9/Cf-9 rapidly elicited protein [Parasponia andersonii]|uniref:Avr9/Cf-9 rapidly elicited protein n=1 Tax=Parasponia andersonii TaxID=3476 RepID=A0A2P5DJM9_PARAD|nr:Avr9/Cf-9 rapidly elicited protein [Parasponia andersonii]